MDTNIPDNVPDLSPEWKRWIESVALTRLQQTTVVLRADVERCLDETTAGFNSDGGPDQFWARALVRAFFVLVEATIFEMKQIVMAAHRAGFHELRDEELGVLVDATYELDARARPRRRPKYVPVQHLARFVHMLFGRVFGVETSLPVGEVGWKDFSSAIKIRNRLTHPKGPETLELSSAELKTVALAFRWFFNAQGDLLRLIHDEVASERFDRRFIREQPES